MILPRYVLYTRVSTQEQDSNNSHESQLAALQAHVVKRGGLTVEIIRETASGGSFLGRLGIRRAIELLERDEADVLACYDFSRYSRDVEHQQQIARRLKSAGKQLEFATIDFARGEDGFLTPESDLMFGVSGSFAAYHKAKIRADCMRGAKQAALNGNQTRRKAPYGYHIVTKGDVLAGRYQSANLGKYFVIESEAEVVRDVFEQRATGRSFVEISRQLEKRGIRTRLGEPFTISGLSKITSNSVYIGAATFGRTRRVGDESRLEKGLRCDFKIVFPSDTDVIKIPAPAIVDESLFITCAKLRQMPRNANLSALGDTRARFLLSSVLKCPRCGGPMIGKTARRSATGVRTGRRKRGSVATEPKTVKLPFYICRYADMGQRAIPCLGRQYPAAEFDHRILAFLRAAASDIDVLNTTLRSESPYHQIEGKRIGSLETQIRELEEKERKLIETSLSLGNIGGDILSKMLLETGTQKQALHLELQGLLANARHEITPKRSEQIRRALSNVRRLLDAPDALTPLSKTLQQLHSFMRLNFERIDFEEPEAFKIDNLKVTLKM